MFKVVDTGLLPCSAPVDRYRLRRACLRSPDRAAVIGQPIGSGRVEIVAHASLARA
jgi:hypothetical protein